MKRILTPFFTFCTFLLLVQLSFGATQYPVSQGYQQFFDANGIPLSGGSVYTCQPGTTCTAASHPSLKDTYSDSTGASGSKNANPIVLDSAGRANIWGTGFYKIAVYDALGNLIKSNDNVPITYNYIAPVTVPWADCKSYGSVTAALTAIGTTPTVLVISDTEAVTSTVIAPPTVSWIVYPKGIISVASGKTLTINGQFSAGSFQAFAGTGTVTFGDGSVSEIFPAWWGALGDGLDASATVNTAAIQAAYYSFPELDAATKSPVVKFGVGIYKINDTVTINRWGTKTSGVGSMASYLVNIGTGPAIVVTHPPGYTYNQGVVFTDIAIGGNGGVYGAGATGTYGIVLDASPQTKFYNVRIANNGSHGIYMENGNWGTTIEECYIINNAGDGINAVNRSTDSPSTQNGDNTVVIRTICLYNGGDGIRWGSAQLEFTGNDFESNKGAGVHIDAESIVGSSGASAVNITGNYMENNNSGQILFSSSSVTTYRPIDSVKVSGNYIYSSLAGATDATALVIGNGNGYVGSLRNIVIDNTNYFLMSGTKLTKWINFDTSDSGTRAGPFTTAQLAYVTMQGAGLILAKDRDIALSNMVYQGVYTVTTLPTTDNIYAVVTKTNYYYLPIPQQAKLISFRLYITSDATAGYAVATTLYSKDVTGTGALTQVATSTTTTSASSQLITFPVESLVSYAFAADNVYYIKVAITGVAGGTTMTLNDPIITVRYY